MKVEGRGVIITGATSGIGYEITKLLYSKGARILAIGRNESALEGLKKEFPNLKVLRVDLADRKARKIIIPYALEVLEDLSILINNAGVGYFGKTLGSNPEIFDRVMEVNFWAPLDLSLSFASIKSGQKSIIVNIISLIAFVPLPKWNIYAVSKSAERVFFISLREELRKYGIKVINVYPPAVKTPFFENSLGEKPKPVGFMVDPQKVASKVLNAIEREKEEVFLSFRDFIIAKIGSLFSPTISKLYGFR